MARRSYQVGYGKPPIGTRFRKDQSGNPRGRPKGAKNLANLLEAELGRTIQVTEGDRRRRVTYLDALVMRLVRDAIAGKANAQRILLDLLQMLEGQAAAAGSEHEASELSASKRAALNAFRRLVLDEQAATDRPDAGSKEDAGTVRSARRQLIRKEQK